MIAGKKCYLTGVRPESIETLRIWRNNPELRQYFRTYKEITKPMQAEWYRRGSNSSKQYDFEIRDLETGKLIGHTGLYYVDSIARKAEFAIYIGDMDFRGKGLGSDALRTLIKYGFQELNLNKIWCEVFSNNAAIDIYRRIGFVDEGVLRQNVFKHGKYLDSFVLSLLREEWLETDDLK